MFVVVAVAALAAVGLTTMSMTMQTASAGGQCHINQGTQACTGSGGGTVCNFKPDKCHDTGKH